jgi:hypothetical protein
LPSAQLADGDAGLLVHFQRPADANEVAWQDLRGGLRVDEAQPLVQGRNAQLAASAWWRARIAGSGRGASNRPRTSAR